MQDGTYTITVCENVSNLHIHAGHPNSECTALSQSQQAHHWRPEHYPSALYGAEYRIMCWCDVKTTITAVLVSSKASEKNEKWKSNLIRMILMHSMATLRKHHHLKLTYKNSFRTHIQPNNLN